MTTQQALRSRRFAPPEVRRQQLIEATLEVLAENGVSGTTMAEVTRRAGLSMGIVSLHFQSKDNLLTATLRHLSEELREVWAPIYENSTLPAAERLASIISASFDDVTSSPTKMKAWFAFFGETRYREIYDEMVNGYDDERIDAMEQLCDEIIADGGYDDVCPETLAASIECLCDGLWLSMILCPGWLTPDGARQQVLDIVARHFPRHFTLSGVRTPARRSA